MLGGGDKDRMAGGAWFNLNVGGCGVLGGVVRGSPESNDFWSSLVRSVMQKGTLVRKLFLVFFCSTVVVAVVSVGRSCGA